jgi:hypothetical protein
MVRLRYADMPGGIRARINRGHHPGRVTIVLAPDMTGPRRRAMLRRLIRNSRIPGYGPPLPAAGVWGALAWDVAAANVRNAVAAMRLHPAQSLLCGAFVAGVVTCYMMFAAVSVQIRPAAPGPGGPPLIPVARHHHRRRPGRPAVYVPPPERVAMATSPAATEGRQVPSPLTATAAPQPSPPVPASPSPSSGACLRLGPVGVCVGG